MRLTAIGTGVCILALAAAAFAGQEIEETALDLARGALDRALRVGNDRIIPRAELEGVILDEVYFVHHPESMARAYGLVPMRSADGTLLGLIGIDTEATKCLWYNFNFPLDEFPPVTASEAAGRIAASRRALGLAEDVPEPVLIEGCDRQIYWRFAVPAGDSWLIDAVRTDAEIIGTHDGTAREALSPRAARPDIAEPGPGLGAGTTESDAQPVLAAMPACYDIPGVPYHFQITSWYCGPASLQMIMDYHGEEIGQHNIADVADDVVGSGTYTYDMRRAGHFSGMSVAVQDPALQGYTQRKLGYACNDNNIFSNPRQKLKNAVWSQVPVFVLTWFSGTHTSGHYRVVKGYDDSLDVFIMHDPWYSGGLCGPDLIIDQAFFVDDLWAYSGHWGMMASPWVLTPTIDNPVSVGDTFTVDLEILYPGPNWFSGLFPCTDCEATISLSPGLSLAGGAATQSLADMSSNDSTTVSWDVVAVGPAGEWGMSFQSQGLVTASSGAYPTYTDSIGGHAYETVSVGSTLLAGWQAEERLTSGDGSSQTCFPGGRAMVTEDDGTLHLVWTDTRDDNGEVYYRKRTGAAWGAEVRLTDEPSHSFGPCIALGPAGDLHVAWVDWRDGNQEIYYKSWDEIGGWTADERVTAYGEIDRNPALAVGDTAVYLAWESRQGGAYRTAAVQFAYRTAAGWTAPVDVDASPARDSYRPSMTLGTDGLLHLVYERQTANEPDEMEKIVHKSWDGLVWSGRTGISTDSSFSRNPVIAAGPGSTLHVVWHDGENVNTDIFYAMFDGVVWQPVEEIVTGGFETATPSVAVDGTGKVHVAWSDHRHVDTEIYTMTKTGATWGDETRITAAAEPSVLPCVTANSTGLVSIVWTDQRHAQADLYFIQSESDAGIPTARPEAGAAGQVRLARPYPTPFTTEARIAFSLGEAADISLEVFDVKGRLIRKLAEGRHAAGLHSVAWDGRDRSGAEAAPGVYFIRCASPAGNQVRRAVLVR